MHGFIKKLTNWLARFSRNTVNIIRFYFNMNHLLVKSVKS